MLKPRHNFNKFFKENIDTIHSELYKEFVGGKYLEKDQFEDLFRGGVVFFETGENVYNTNCQICHGEQLANTGQTFDLRRLKDNERARFDNSVRNGKNQMPPWKGVLTDEEIDQLWHYIRANAFQK